MERQELSDRKHKPGEDLESYIDDINKLCKKLNLSPKDRLHFFVQNLEPSLRDYVILGHPKTYDEAEHLARRKSSLAGNKIARAQNDAELKQVVIDSIRDNIKGFQSSPQVGASEYLAQGRDSPRGGTCQNFDRDARPIFLGLKFGQILFFWVGKFFIYFSGFRKISAIFLGLTNFQLFFGSSYFCITHWNSFNEEHTVLKNTKS